MISKLTGPTLLIVLLSGPTWGEIYKTTDEEGNTVFTDVPPTEQSELVDLPDANIADSVEPAPRSEAEASPPSQKSVGASPQPDDNVTIIGDSYDDRLEEKIAHERRKEVLEGERPAEVLDADPPRDMREAERIEHRPPVQRPMPHRR